MKRYVGLSVHEGACTEVVYWMGKSSRQCWRYSSSRVFALVQFDASVLTVLCLGESFWLLCLKANTRNCGSGTVRQVPEKQGAMAFCSQKSDSVDSEG